MSQVAPSWCLLSSTIQFGNGAPKPFIPVAFFRPVQPQMNVVLNISFSGQAISIHFHQFPINFHLFLAILINFLPVWAIYSPHTAPSNNLQPYPSISSHFYTNQNFFENIEFLKSLLFIMISSWDSVPLLMCYQMQAPHWSQSHILDSQCAAGERRRRREKSTNGLQ